ncbi:hypothetical protein [Alsobacter sp. R-9]
MSSVFGLELMKLVPTTILGLIAVYIAWRQYTTAQAQHRTAQEKLALDLFEKRTEVFNLATQAVQERLTVPVGDRKEFAKMHEAIGRARFLFGDEVRALLKSTLEDMAHHAVAEDKMTRPLSDDQRGQELDATIARIDKLIAFYDNLANACEPYMRMDQKLPVRKK